MAVDGSGNESVIVASTSAFLQTLSLTPIPTTPSSFVTSLVIMTPGMFGGSVLSATPYSGMENLPIFLVGVPMTKAINNNDYACALDSGLIHAYGLRVPAWTHGGLTEPGTEVVYS